MRTRTLVGLGVFLFILVVAGASGSWGGWFGQEGPVSVTVKNADNVTHTFEVSVVDLPGNVTVYWSDGQVSTRDAGMAGVATHDPGDYRNITAIELPGSARTHGRYSLEPGEEKQTSVGELPRDFAIVVAVYGDDEVGGWVSSTCSGNLAFLRVTMNDYGVSAAYHCQGGIFA